MHFAVSPKVSFVQEFALCKQLEQSNALATGQCRLLFYSECKEIAMHHFFWDTLYNQNDNDNETFETKADDIFHSCVTGHNDDDNYKMI